MNLKARCLVDFDRTLFDTSHFVDWLWETLEKKYGVDGQYEKERAKDFYLHSGDWYDYQFFDHLKAIPALSSVSPKELAAELQSMERPAFLFADAAAILDSCNEIITFGNRPYQEFKLGFCPEVANLPATIIQESKSAYIATHYEAPLMLIDDKHLEDELPSWVLFVLIDRRQKEPVKHYRDNFVAINSLMELFAAIK